MHPPYSPREHLFLMFVPYVMVASGVGLVAFLIVKLLLPVVRSIVPALP